MKVSLCMIAKNAAPDIRRPLESLRGQVDETIVIDTGSTDETSEIARLYGAQVYSFAWREDFAAAKNFALEKANGDWIVFLDTDEWFAGGTGSSLRQTVAKYNDVDALLLKMYNVDADRQDACVDAFYTARIFQRAPYIRYRGSIHEQIYRTDGRALRTRQVSEKALVLYHCGYSGSRLQEKAERNLRILQEEIKKGADPTRFYGYLAEAYSAQGNEAEALRYARLDIALGRQPVTYASRSYRVGIEALKALNAPTAELEAMLQQAVRDFPEVPDFCAEYALFCYQKQRYAEAKAKFEQALRLQENYRGLEPSIFYQSVELAKQFLQQIEEEWKRESKNVKITKLSLCVLVKDEEKRLSAWLMRMRGCVDEVLVVDTGSTDRSKQVAADAGAKVCDFIWTQDFAAARNFAIAQAAGEWLLFLDADEVLAEYVTKETLYEAVSQARQAGCDAVLCTIINLDTDQGRREMSRMAQTRLLRKAAALRFDRPVHEILTAVGRDMKVHRDENIEIFHTGDSSGQRRKKRQRDLEILQRAIEKDGEQAWQYRYLSEAHLELRQYDMAIHYAEMHLKAGSEATATDRMVYGTLIDAMLLARRPEAALQVVLTEALGRFPQAAELLARYGESLWRQEAFAQAKEQFLQALQADASGETPLAVDRFPALRDGVYERLGEIVLMEGVSGAADFFKQALGCNKYNMQALRYLLLLLLRENETAARDWLAGAYALDRRDLGFILRVLEQTQIGALYAEYAERYAKVDSGAKERAAQYHRLATGESEAAREKALETLPLCLQKYLIACFFIPREKKLPEVALATSFAALLERFRGGAPLESSAFSAYMALLPEVLRYEGAEMLRQYAEMGLDFTDEALLEIGKKLFAGNAYALAAPFYMRYAEQGGAMAPLSRFEAGVAQYAAGELQAAKAFLESARDCEEKRWEIEAYLTWIEEKWRDG